MKKKIAATLLVAALFISTLAGCGNNQSSSDSGNQSGSDSATTQTDQGTNSSDGADQGEAPTLSTEIDTLKVYMPLVGSGPTNDLDKVVAAINEYIEPLIYADMELEYISYSQWEDQMNMMVASGNQVDLMCSVREISSYYKNGALIPMTDLIENYGQGIKDYVEQIYLDSCTFGGELYGVPTIRDMAKEQAPEIPCVLMRNSVRSFDSWCGWDAIGDNYGVVMMGQDNVELVNLFESEEYVDLLHRMRRWFQNGIINPEAPTADIQWADIVPTGRILGRFARSKPGYELQETVRYVTDLLASSVGIDPEYYEAAMLGGAIKWQQIKYVTLPFLKGTIITMFLLPIGRMFYSDFGLFYQVPMSSGLLYDVTSIFDTYVLWGSVLVVFWVLVNADKPH